jgi:antitoxin YefM
VRINSESGDAVLMSAEDFESWPETMYLLRSPANARRLMEAVARDQSGRATVAKTMELETPDHPGSSAESRTVDDPG